MANSEDKSAVMQIGIVILVFVVIGVALVILANMIA